MRHLGPIHIKRLTASSIKRMPARSIKRGGAFDFFGFLDKIGKTIQKGIDYVAPYTAKAVIPIASALTGIPLPSVNLASPNLPDLGKAASSVTSAKPAALDNAKADIGGILRGLMGKGVTSKKPARSAKKGKGLSLL